MLWGGGTRDGAGKSRQHHASLGPILAWGAWIGTSLCADPSGELRLDEGLPQPSAALAFGTVRAGFVRSVIRLGQPRGGSSRFIETKEVCSAPHHVRLADHKRVPECSEALQTTQELLPWAASFRDLCHTVCVEQSLPRRSRLKSHARQGLKKQAIIKITPFSARAERKSFSHLHSRLHSCHCSAHPFQHLQKVFAPSPCQWSQRCGLGWPVAPVSPFPVPVQCAARSNKCLLSGLPQRRCLFPSAT